MKTYVIHNDNAPDVRFTGELLASVTSRGDGDSCGRWTNLDLYKTAGGKYVCHQIGVTCREGERDRYRVEVCADEAEVIDFFGHGWLAKALYDESGILDVVDVD